MGKRKYEAFQRLLDCGSELTLVVRHRNHLCSPLETLGGGQAINGILPQAVLHMV